MEIKHDVRCDIVANRLVMDGVLRTAADFEARFQTAWKHLYPDIPAPSGEDGLRGMWVSSRIMLEVSDICLAARNSLITFVRERVMHYHMIRLKPTVMVSDLRSAVLNDLTRLNLLSRDTEYSLDRAIRSYTSRIKPHLIDPSRMDFNARECMLITEFYRYLLQHLSFGAVAVRPAAPIAKRDPAAAVRPAPAAAENKTPAPSNALIEIKKAQPPLVVSQSTPVKTESQAPVKPEPKAEPQTPVKPEPKAEPQTPVKPEPKTEPQAPIKPEPKAEPEKAAAEATPENNTEPVKRERSGRGGRRRSQPPEVLEERTLRRLRGQFAIDLLMATRVEPQEDELLANDDEDDSELDLFIEACAESTTYKNYTPEQCTELWNSVLNEDRILFARGSLTALVDLRFTIIATRCLMMALVEAKDSERGYLNTFVEKAAGYCEAFRLDYKPEVVRERLRKLCKNTYLVKERMPMSVLELLREHKQDIIDAYNLYVEQSDAEAQLREQEIARQVEEIRRKDALRRRNDQHAEIVRLIRDFGSNELGWLCMAVSGLACSKDNLLYQLDGVLQKLEALGIEPFAAGLAAENFDGSDPAAKEVIDLSGHPLQHGVKYRLLQPGWKYQGEIVVWPKADRVK